MTKRFGSLLANDAISFDLMAGEVVALLGENGAGKTTLMNILFGHYTADAGSIEVYGQPLPSGDPRAALAVGIGMVHQHFTLADNLSVIDNLMLGTQPLLQPRLHMDRARKRIAELARDFGLAVDPDATVSALTVGERQRAEILKALYRNARILILDEPTAVLTPIEADALFATLKTLVARGLSVIFISHKLHEVMAVSDRVLVLRAGKLSGERVTSKTSRSELAELMVGQPVKAPAVAFRQPGAPALELVDVSTTPGGRATPLRTVNLALHEGEIIGIAGVSGNGQASLANLVSGTEQAAGGVMRIAGQQVRNWSARAALEAGIGRIPEDRHAVGTVADMSITENAILERYGASRFSRYGLLNWAAAREFAEAIIRNYAVKTPSAETPIRLLSGGNMQKVILGRALDGNPPVILANQPARGLDIGAVTFVHERLLEARSRGAAILLISEDLEEVMALADRIHVMFDGRLSSSSQRGELSLRELGELMGGEGFGYAA